MAKIEASDRITLNSTPQKVYEAFMDFNHYQQWWPSKWQFTVVKEGNVGGEIMVLRGNIRLMLTIVDLRPGREIQFLVEGDVNGRATVRFEYQGGQTEVQYQFSLQPRSMSLLLLSNVVPYGRQFSAVMAQAAAKLQQILPTRS